MNEPHKCSGQSEFLDEELVIRECIEQPTGGTLELRMRQRYRNDYSVSGDKTLPRRIVAEVYYLHHRKRRPLIPRTKNQERIGIDVVETDKLMTISVFVNSSSFIT